MTQGKDNNKPRIPDSVDMERLKKMRTVAKMMHTSGVHYSQLGTEERNLGKKMIAAVDSALASGLTKGYLWTQALLSGLTYYLYSFWCFCFKVVLKSSK